jgi:hypothetical protein
MLHDIRLKRLARGKHSCVLDPLIACEGGPTAVFTHPFSYSDYLVQCDFGRINPAHFVNWHDLKNRKLFISSNAKDFDISDHRHLSNIDYLKARTACLVCFISTVNGHCKKEALKD